MNLPRVLKIGPYRYTVTIMAGPFTNQNGTRVAGDITHSLGEIRIANGPPHRMFETMLHEALHAIDYLAHTDLTEKQTWRLAAGLAAFLIDNGFVAEPE